MITMLTFSRILRKRRVFVSLYKNELFVLTERHCNTKMHDSFTKHSEKQFKF